jgi:hypothetical protein
MSELVIGPPLADQLRALAEREKRPIDAVLTDMLLRYQSSLSKPLFTLSAHRASARAWQHS